MRQLTVALLLSVAAVCPCVAGDGVRIVLDGAFLSLSQASDPFIRVAFDGNPSSALGRLGIGYAPIKSAAFGVSAGYGALYIKKGFRPRCSTCNSSVTIDEPRRLRIIPFEMWLSVRARAASRIHPVLVASAGPTWRGWNGLDDGDYGWTGRALAGIAVDAGHPSFEVLAGWQHLDGRFGLVHPDQTEDLSGWTVDARMTLRFGRP